METGRFAALLKQIDELSGIEQERIVSPETLLDAESGVFNT